MGTLIGKGGSVIKSIQDESGARLNASEEPLPMSTERTITIQGTPAAVQQSISRIGNILMEHTDRTAASIVQYRPTPQLHGRNGNNNGGGYMNMRTNNAHPATSMGYGGMMPMGGMPMNNSQFYYQGGPTNAGAGAYGGMPNARGAEYSMGAMGMGAMGMGAMGMGAMTGMVTPSQAQQIFIPNEMVNSTSWC